MKTRSRVRRYREAERKAAKAQARATNRQVRTNSPELARHILVTRIDRGWTQRELARRCGLSDFVIAQAELGRSISVTSRKKIVDIIGKPPIKEGNHDRT